MNLIFNCVCGFRKAKLTQEWHKGEDTEKRISTCKYTYDAATAISLNTDYVLNQESEDSEEYTLVE